MIEPNVDGMSRSLVVGSGAMGSQIGMVFDLSGYEVTVQDTPKRCWRRRSDNSRLAWPETSKRGERARGMWTSPSAG